MRKARRRAARGVEDANAGELDRAASSAGASVLKLSEVGGGCPDRLIGYGGGNYLIEYKTDEGRERPSQKDFRASWRGAAVTIVRSARELLEAIGALAKTEG